VSKVAVEVDADVHVPFAEAQVPSGRRDPVEVLRSRRKPVVEAA